MLSERELLLDSNVSFPGRGESLKLSLVLELEDWLPADGRDNVE